MAGHMCDGPECYLVHAGKHWATSGALNTKLLLLYIHPVHILSVDLRSHTTGFRYKLASTPVQRPGLQHSNTMNGTGEATTPYVTYNVLWLCSTNGMNEATEGRIEIVSVLNTMDVGASSEAVGGNHRTEARHEDLISFTADGSAETSDTTSNASEVSSTQDITCIAKLTWGSWKATFLGSYNPPNASYRSNKGALFDFNIRATNEWMDIGLKGLTITRLGIDCPQRDDRGHEILVLHMVWKQSTLEPRTAMLFAKRELGEASLGFSEGEFRELGIPRNSFSNRLLRQRDVQTSSTKPDYRQCHKGSTTGKVRCGGRTGYIDGARGASRGNRRGNARGRVKPVKKPSHGMTWHAWEQKRTV